MRLRHATRWLRPWHIRRVYQRYDRFVCAWQARLVAEIAMNALAENQGDIRYAVWDSYHAISEFTPEELTAARAAFFKAWPMGGVETGCG